MRSNNMKRYIHQLLFPPSYRLTPRETKIKDRLQKTQIESRKNPRLAPSSTAFSNSPQFTRESLDIPTSRCPPLSLSHLTLIARVFSRLVSLSLSLTPCEKSERLHCSNLRRVSCCSGDDISRRGVCRKTFGSSARAEFFTPRLALSLLYIYSATSSEGGKNISSRAARARAL